VFAAWSAEMKQLALQSNVACLQLGGVVSQFHNSTASARFAAIKPYIVAAVDIFGYNRTCYESNWCAFAL